MTRFLHIVANLLILTLLLPYPALAAKKKTNGDQTADSRPLALLSEMKHWSNPDYTRISLEFDRDVTWEAHELGKGSRGKPGRVYIDINRAKLGSGAKDITIGDGLLKGVRLGQHKLDVVRVVLDTENIKDYKIFPLSEPARLVIDVRGERRAEISRLENTIAAKPAPTQSAVAPPAPEPKHATPPVVEKKVKPHKKPLIAKIRRIVVDPGHGGHDSGALGPNGVKEKDVVLAIGLKLRDLLKDELGLDVVMTRATDVFIPLEERTAIANKVNADLFVSVHANAALNRGASGIETYYLNLAKTEKAAQLAAKENGTTLEKVSVLQAILFDLMANYKLNDSAHLADEVQRSLHGKIKSRHADVRNLGVKQGPFYVLVGATMPSILVETAFVSNVQEESRLTDPAYQEQTAEGIMEGIRAYITSLK
ncbi:AMIN domain-containing protein [Oryzomonas japonica]|uniref:N-acetylmuramoyl-L-alanine amidase n=1 Tax=Oryzomonas japonica TaxID=2603858 RepID=A0A7J4ZR74_9BACT|nr:N-acetylmuramoyl-L-alanine amidase [Oryzomonas japonica]KAB0665670.1 AMIN domain-containing protein [Oryzomonas japonica]